MKGQETLKRANETLRRENEALREPISTLSMAALRISAGLDLDTVLHEAIDGARALTGSGRGVITTVDESGQPEDFATSGFTEDEQRNCSTSAHSPARRICRPRRPSAERPCVTRAGTLATSSSSTRTAEEPAEHEKRGAGAVRFAGGHGHR